MRASTDIVALVSEHTALRQQGRRWVGLCPFHAESTPSFSVNAEEGFYYCFGCHESGDAITFVRATERLDFAESVRLLADRAGIVLHETEGATDRRRRSELIEAMTKAVAWYHERLLSAPDAGRARDYLRSRGYDGAVVRRFQLGWAPDDWDAMARALALTPQVATETGLGFVNRAGRIQDALRARVLFPIFDPSGRPIAIGGRLLPEAGGASARPHGNRRTEPKYKNSPETPIYSKRRTLYGLNWAKHDVVASGEVVVCEGYTDVIGCFIAGIERAVATCGTALGEEHFRLLRNFGRRIVLAYDADQAGQSATARVYEWERRHDVDVRVAQLPGGADPADLARADPDALRKAVAGSVPFLQFRVDRVLAVHDLSTPEGRARAAEAALAAISQHPDPLVRDPYLMRVADATRLEPELLRARAASLQTPSAAMGGERPERSHRLAGHGVPAEARARRPAVNRPGLAALRLAVHRPELVADRLEEVLFVDELQRRAFVALAGAESLQDAVDGADEEVASLLRRLAVEEPDLPESAPGDAAGTLIARLAREAASRALAGRVSAARIGQLELADVNVETASVRRWIAELDDPARSREAADRLVAWLLGVQEGPARGAPRTRTTEPG